MPTDAPDTVVDVRAAIGDAAAQFEGFSATPRLDAELLMAHALGVERDALLLDPARYTVPEGFAALVARRAAQEPIAYIVGYRDFWTIRLIVAPGVLIPRADSETLLEAAVDAFAGTDGPKRILDLGTGPGTLLLAALAQWPGATGVGLERSQVARDIAWRNAGALGFAVRADIRSGDWTQTGWADALGQFDLILCNPPYVEDAAKLARQVANYEPGEALFAGPDGLDDYLCILPRLPHLMSAGGLAVVEIGATQAETLTMMAQQAGFAVACRQDLGGNDRALVLRARGEDETSR